MYECTWVLFLKVEACHLLPAQAGFGPNGGAVAREAFATAVARAAAEVGLGVFATALEGRRVGIHLRPPPGGRGRAPPPPPYGPRRRCTGSIPPCARQRAPSSRRKPPWPRPAAGCGRTTATPGCCSTHACLIWSLGLWATHALVCIYLKWGCWDAQVLLGASS